MISIPEITRVRGDLVLGNVLIFHRLELSNAKKLSTYRGPATTRQRKVCVRLF